MIQSVKTFLLMWIAFSLPMAAFFTLQYGPKIGIPNGFGSGLLFAAFMSAFTLYQASKFKGQCPLADGETLVKEGPANHFVRAEGVGGWLYLTSHRLYFRSHNVNIQKHELSMPLGEITNAKKSLTLGIIPNGLSVETASGSERFVVNDAHVWVKTIELTKSAMARQTIARPAVIVSQ